MKKTWWLWAIIGVVGLCGFCSVGTLLVGAFAGDSEKGGASRAASAPVGGAPGVEGGFALVVPESFKPDGQGRWVQRTTEGTATKTVELIHLAALAGVNDGPQRVAQLWASTIARDWNGANTTPFVMRRFVQNGARAHFTGAQLHDKKSDAIFFVSLYLVEAGDRLEPLVFVQGYDDSYKTGLAMMASLSWGPMHASVEQVIAGVSGSPVGLPLVSDDEVVGNWQYGSTTTQQWVSTVTGGTSMTANAYSVDMTLDDDHRYTKKFQGASGQVGALKFASDKGAGTWKVEHDLLILDGDDGKQTKYMVTSAAVTPEGKRTLLLMMGRFSAAPMAASSGELFVEK